MQSLGKVGQHIRLQDRDKMPFETLQAMLTQDYSSGDVFERWPPEQQLLLCLISS